MLLGSLLASCGDDTSLTTVDLFTYEEGQPVVSISGPDFVNANVSSDYLQYQIKVDRAVINELSASDPGSITIENGEAVELVTIDTVELDEYLLYLQPDAEAQADQIIITIPAGAVTTQVDDGLFPNNEVNFSIEYDNSPPDLNITVQESAGTVFLEENSTGDFYYVVNDNFSLLLQFDEEVRGFAETDILIPADGVYIADVVALSGGSSYRVDIELAGSEILSDVIDIYFTIVEGAVEDLSGERVEQALIEADIEIEPGDEFAGYSSAEVEYFVALDRQPPIISTVVRYSTSDDFTRTANFNLDGSTIEERSVPLKAGDMIEVVVEFAEPIVITGDPYIPIGIDAIRSDSSVAEVNKSADVLSLSPNSQGTEDAAVTFAYIVQGDSNLEDIDGVNASPISESPIVVVSDGARIADKYGNSIAEDIVLSPAYTLSDLRVDTIAPELLDLTWAAEDHVYGSEDESGRFSVGEIITFSISFSEVVYPENLQQSINDYTLSIRLKTDDSVETIDISGSRHVVENGASVFQFDYFIEEGQNAISGIAYDGFAGPIGLFGDEANNDISQDLGDLLFRSSDDINIYIDAELPEIVAIREISSPAASSVLPSDGDAHYYVGANYKSNAAEIIQLQFEFSEPVAVAALDLTQASALNLVSYFKDNGLPASSGNTYNFTYTGSYDGEFSDTLILQYEVVPFSEPGTTPDDLDGIEIDYLLLNNVSIKDSYGNDLQIDNSDDLNLIYTIYVSSGDVSLDFLENIRTDTTPAEVVGITFNGVNNGETLPSVLGEGGVVEIVLEFDQVVEFDYSLSGGNSVKPSLAVEIVEETAPELTGAATGYAYYASPGLDVFTEFHTFTYTIKPEDANHTLSSLWLLRNSTLADTGGYDDIMIVPTSSAYDERNRDIQTDFAEDALTDNIFADDYARHPVIPIKTGVEPILYFNRPDGYDSSAEVNDYYVYPLEGETSISFTLAYGYFVNNVNEVTQVQIGLQTGGDSTNLPYLLLYGDLIENSSGGERREARAYLSLEESALVSSGVYSDLVFILHESEDPTDEFAAQYVNSESLGLVYDSLVIGDDYTMVTNEGNPIETDLSLYTYNNDSSLTFSAIRERVFYDPYPRVLSIEETRSGFNANDNSYNLGELIEVTVHLSEEVEVSGAGEASLYLLGDVVDADLDGYYSDVPIPLAYVADDSSGKELAFAYQVEKDIYADSLTLDSNDSRRYIETTGSLTIKDLSVAGRDLRSFGENLTFSYATSVSSIDSRAPQIESISVSNEGRVLTEETGTIHTFTTDDQLVFSLTFASEPNIATDDETSIFGDPYTKIDNETGPLLQLEIDPGDGYQGSAVTRYASYFGPAINTSATLAARADYFLVHVFTYIITQDDHDTTGIKLVGPLDDSFGTLINLPDATSPDDNNEANLSLRRALVDLGMESDSELEEYELDYVIVDNFPRLVDFHVDTAENNSHLTNPLSFSANGFKEIQFYGLVNKSIIDESTINISVKLPFEIYDSRTGDSESFIADYVGWASRDGDIDITTGTGIDIGDYYDVTSDNYSVFLFTFNFDSSARSANVNADTIIIPENPFENYTFNPKDPTGAPVDLSISETTITSIDISEVNSIVIDFKPPEIISLTLPEEGLYYYSTDAASVKSALTYKVEFSEAVYAPNLLQYPNGTPRLYQSIGSGDDVYAICFGEPCAAAANDPTIDSSVRIVSDADNLLNFVYEVTASDSGYIDGFYVQGGPDSDDTDTINTITDAYGNILDGYTLPALSDDERDLSDPSSINLLVDNSELAIIDVSLPAAGIYQSGDRIELVVTFSREIELPEPSVNQPSISFLIGDQDSDYAEGSIGGALQADFEQKSTAITFAYAVNDGIGMDDYSGIELLPSGLAAAIDWKGYDVVDVLRPTETVDTTSSSLTDLSAFIADEVLSDVAIDVKFPSLVGNDLQLLANKDSASDDSTTNDYHYYLNSYLIFGLAFNESVTIPQSGSGYQSFIEFTYRDANGTEQNRSVSFDPATATSVLATYDIEWDYLASDSSADIYFVYQVGADDVTSSNAADGSIALRDYNISGIIDRSGKEFSPTAIALTPNNAIIDLDKTSIYSYNIFAIDESDNTYPLYQSITTSGAGPLTQERYITSGQDLVLEFSFRHDLSSSDPEVVFDLGGNTGLYLDIDIYNELEKSFLAPIQEDSSDPKSYSDGTSRLRYLLDLSSEEAPISDVDGIGVAFPEATKEYYRDQSGAVNLNFSAAFETSLDYINVDTQGPSIEAVYMQPSDTGLTLYYGHQDELQITVQFDEPISLSSGSFDDIDLNFSLYDTDQSNTVGTVTRTASYLTNIDASSYVFAYLVDEAQDSLYEQIYFDEVVLVSASGNGADITETIGDVRADPNALTSATFTYAITDAAVEGHALDFDSPSIASIIIPPGSPNDGTISLGGGDELALTLVTSREVAFASDSQPRLRLYADATKITFNYVGDYNSSLFNLSHTFTYTVASNVETNASGLYIPEDALILDNSGASDAANNQLNTELNISTGSEQFETSGTGWSANPTEYINIDSRIPDFVDAFIPPQSITLDYSGSAGITFTADDVFTLDAQFNSSFRDEFSAGFVEGDAATAVDLTRPTYQTEIDGTPWYIWSSTQDKYYRISTDDPYDQPWLFTKATDISSIQDVFFPTNINDFGELISGQDAEVWYLVDDLDFGGQEFAASNYSSDAGLDAIIDQRYQTDEFIYIYLVLSEQVAVASDFASEGSYGNYPDYSITYTDAYDGVNAAAELPMQFSHWIEARADASSSYNKQVMVYANELNASTVNSQSTSLQPARDLADAAQLAIQDLFGNDLVINEDNSTSIYSSGESNSITGVQLSGYLVDISDVSLYYISEVDSDLISIDSAESTYIIDQQLALDITFSEPLTETSYDPDQDFFLTLRFNDASSKEHVLGDSNPAGGTDYFDQRYWYNSIDTDYDGFDQAGFITNRSETATTDYNNVLRYIFTIPDRASGDDYNTDEEGVSDPNLTIVDLSLGGGLEDGFGSAVDVDEVLAQLQTYSLPIRIDSVRPQIYLTTTGDYSRLAAFNTYSRDDYFATLNANDSSYHPSVVTFEIAFSEALNMPAKSSTVESGESDFSAGLRFQLRELDGTTIGDRFAPSAYTPYAGTGEAPVYTATQFTYQVTSLDDSVVIGADINATLYDLAGNVNYYSSADSNDSVFNSIFASVLYNGVDLDGLGAKAIIADSDDVDQKVVQLDGPIKEVDVNSDTPYGVGSVLYFELTYDQNIYTNNILSAAEDISLFLKTDAVGTLVEASVLGDQLNSYGSDSEISNRELTFTYTLSESDTSATTGYLLDSLDYSGTSAARYGILDAYGNGINDTAVDLTHVISSLNIFTAPIDTEMPFIEAVTIGSAQPLYGNGDTVSFILTLSEQVSLVESNFLDADQGLRFKIESTSGADTYRTAHYNGVQEDNTTFAFTYVVGSTEDNDNGDIYLDDMTLLGDTYDNALNLESNLTYDGPTSGSADSGSDVDSGPANVIDVALSFTPSGGSVNPVLDGTDYTLGIGTQVQTELIFDESITFDENANASDVPYLEIKAVDAETSDPQLIRANLTSASETALQIPTATPRSPSPSPSPSALATPTAPAITTKASKASITP